MADQMLTMPQVAAQLGCSLRTVYRRVYAGWFDKVDIGDKASKTRIPQSSVDRALAKRTTPGRKAA